MFKRMLVLSTISLSLISFTSCGDTNLTGTTTSGISASGSFSELFLAMRPEQQNMFARVTSSTELQQLAADPTNASYIAAVDALGTARPELLSMLQNPGQGAGGMPPGGAGGMPPGDMGMGGMPGGLPPNAEALRIEYPEFIAALEAMQDLDPEARRTAMDTLFAEHPEWQELMRPQGGPQGMPPGRDPMAQPAAQASAAPDASA